MAIDPNIALQVNNEIFPSPQEFLGKLEGLRKLHNENLLFKMQRESQEAQGQLAQRFTQPDGTFDHTGFLLEVAKDPRTAWDALNIRNQALARRKQEEELQQAEMASARQRYGMLSGGLSGLVALGDNVTKADVLDMASRLVQELPGDKKFYTSILKEVSSAPAGGRQLAQWVQQRHMQMQPFAEVMAVTAPPPMQVDRGGSVEIIQAPRVPGAPAVPVGSVVKTPTTAERNALVPARDTETGQPLARSREEVAPMSDGGGRPEGPAVPTMPSRALGPTAETEMDLTQAPKQYAERMGNVREQILGAQRNMQEIAKMRDLLERAGTGKFSEIRTDLAAAVLALGGESARDISRKIQGGADADAVSAAQQFMKSSWTQALAALKQSMPAGTQWTGQEIFQNYASNPNIKMDAKAARELFDFYTFQYAFLKAEQDFKTRWRAENPNKPLRELDTDWTKFAEAQGWVKPLRTGPGEQQNFVEAPLKRDDKIPDDISLVQLSMIPRGSRVEATLSNGQKIMIRRGTGQEGNTYSVVQGGR